MNERVSRPVEPRLLSPDQAAAYLGLGSRWSIYRLIAAGELPSLKLAGKVRLDRADLDQLIEVRKGVPSLAPTLPRPKRLTLAPLGPRTPARGDTSVTGPSVRPHRDGRRSPASGYRVRSPEPALNSSASGASIAHHGHEEGRHA